MRLQHIELSDFSGKIEINCQPLQSATRRYAFEHFNDVAGKSIATVRLGFARQPGTMVHCQIPHPALALNLAGRGRLTSKLAWPLGCAGGESGLFLVTNEKDP